MHKSEYNARFPSTWVVSRLIMEGSPISWILGSDTEIYINNLSGVKT